MPDDSPNPKSPSPDRWRKLPRRAALAGAALLLLAIIIFVLLPIWISNDQGRAYVLDRLNARLDGPRVTVDKWTLGWFRSTQLTNLRILQPDGTEILSCPHVSSGLTLWDLCRGNYDLRSTTADRLDMRITKFADGTTSLASFARGAGEILRSARGAIQIRDGQLTFASAKTNQTVRYTDVRATLTVASPDAPFHVQITSGGTATTTSSTTPLLNLNGTFPPTGTLSRESAGTRVWPLLADVDFAATHLPTALVCDYAGIDGAWTESFGTMLESAQLTSHGIDQETCRLALSLKGETPATPAEVPTTDALLLLHLPAASRPAEGASLTIAGKDYHADLALRWSSPLAALLGRVNPVLGEASPATPTAPATPATARAALVRANVLSMQIPLDHLDAAELSGRITFPPLLFTPRDGPSMVRQLQVITGELPTPRPGAKQPLEGSASVLRLRLADRRLAYENFLVTLGRTRLNFSGEVGLDGTLDLAVLIPEGTGLSAGSSHVAVGGTVDSPLIKRAQ